MSTLSVSLALLVGLIILKSSRDRAKAGAKLPPGPRGYPFIGNALDVPRSHASMGFAQLSKIYGDIIHMSIFGQRMVVLNTHKLANDVLVSRGETSAGRPHLPMASDLAGYSRFLALMQPTDRHREGRRFLHNAIGSRRAASVYAPAQEAEVGRFLKKLVLDPEGFAAHSRWIVGTFILLFTYGYKTLDYDDPLIESSSTVMKRFSNSAAPGRWLVDLIPMLKHIPSWFPGATFKRIAAEDRRIARETFEKNFWMVKKQIAEGTARRSLVLSFIEDRGSECTKEDEEFIMFTVGDLYGAGLDTMTSGIEAFFLAMLLNPSVQARAQKEIDNLCDNSSRLPTFADKPNLPYTEAVLGELLRWTIITPLGLPHRFTKDEAYGKYVFPKGADVFGNIGAITHDPVEYPNPDEFNPERFLGPPEKRQRDPRDTVFGFGRRQCPGGQLAEQVMFIIIASTLATFDIMPVEGEEYSLKYTDGVISHHLPFKCNIRLRSSQAKSLIPDM